MTNPMNRVHYSDEYMSFDYDPHCEHCHGAGYVVESDGDCGTYEVVCRHCVSNFQAAPQSAPDRLDY